MGPWTHGHMGPWAHGLMQDDGPMVSWGFMQDDGPMGSWTHGPMGPGHGLMAPQAHLGPWAQWALYLALYLGPGPFIWPIILTV